VRQDQALLFLTAHVPQLGDSAATITDDVLATFQREHELAVVCANYTWRAWRWTAPSSSTAGRPACPAGKSPANPRRRRIPA